MTRKPGLLIHIGYHKTGTTFLQRQVFANADVFNLAPWQAVERLLIEPSPYAFDAVSMNAGIAALLRSDRINVFSHEELSGNIHSGGNGRSITWEVAERIARIDVASVRVLMMVREQGDMADSSYRQFVKMGGVGSFADYTGGPGRRRGRLPPFSIEHLRYDEVVAHYHRLLGREAVRVYPYEAFRQDNLAVLDDLFGWLGVRDQAGQVMSAVPRRHPIFSNPSYSVLSLPLARLLNRLFGADAPNPGLLPARRLHRIGKGGLYAFDHYVTRPLGLQRRSVLGREAIEDIRRASADGNSRLQDLLGIDLGRFGYRLGGAGKGDDGA